LIKLTGVRMNTISETYVNSLLADAAYVNLHDGNSNADPLLVGTRLTTVIAARLTRPQAEYITANFEVVTQELSPIGGFDATVWRIKPNSALAGPSNENAGKVYVSMRGTQSATDLADDVELAVKGVPTDQIVAMVNWWLRETAQAGPNTALQIASETLYLDGSTPPVEIGARFVAAPRVGGTGLLFGQSSIAGVNGHSLGGYLATAFTRLFGANVQSASTFNSAGFNNLQASSINTAYNQITQLIGSGLGLASFAEVTPKQTNFFGENGVNFTTNSLADISMPGFNQYGSRVGLNQEELLGGDLGPFNNHSMYKLTDFLALGAALEKLDPTLTLSQINGWIKAGSNDIKASYEGLLDGLRRALFGNTITATPASDNADSPNRVQYHANLKSVVDAIASPGGALQDLQGRATLSVATTSLATTAKTDFAAFLSLNALSPVVISTTDAAAIAALKTANSALSTAWTADNNARLYGDTSKVFDYSDNWYADRAAMLSAIATRNHEDATNLIAPNPSRGLVGGRQFRDLTSGTTLTVGTDVPTNQQIVFGSAGDETGASALNGGSQSDRLYGGAGNDTLNGMGGNDYLEGGSGADIYNFSGTFGQDTVVDAGGVGEIRIDGDIIRGGKLLVGSDKLWISDDDKYKFVQLDNGDLVIQRSTGQATDDSFGRRTERLMVASRMQTLRMSSTPIVREARV
jgi:hypothetical protein